jgi:hypothetical protein
MDHLLQCPHALIMCRASTPALSIALIGVAYLCRRGQENQRSMSKKLSQLKLIQVDVSMYIIKLMNTTKIIVMLYPQMTLSETAECMLLRCPLALILCRASTPVLSIALIGVARTE